MEIAGWLDAYQHACERADADAAAALFTGDALYRSHPFRKPARGRDGIRAYCARATGKQRGAEVELGLPIVDGNRVAVKWWTQMEEDGRDVTLPGCLVLRISADGRCEELHEYWFLEGGRHPPYHGWIWTGMT